jgi:hypothetical protein
MVKLVNAANKKATEEGGNTSEKERIKSKPIESPKELLLAFVQELVMSAVASRCQYVRQEGSGD